MELLFLLLEDAIFSALAATGFAMLFNVPARTLPVCALSGAIGHVLRTVLVYYGWSIEAGSLVAATTVGLLGEYLSHQVHTPAPVFTIPGVIPMVPGTYAFKTMMGVIKLTYLEADQGNEIFYQTITNCIKTGVILSCLSLGIAVTTLIFRKHLN